MGLPITILNAPKRPPSVWCRSEVCDAASYLARIKLAVTLINISLSTVLSRFDHGLGEPTTASEVGTKALVVPPKPSSIIADGDFDPQP